MNVQWPLKTFNSHNGTSMQFVIGRMGLGVSSDQTQLPSQLRLSTSGFFI